jgi:hypothetical protein
LISYVNKYKNKIIVDYLEQNLCDIISKNKYNTNEGIYQQSAPIWVCWLSGEENAPPLIKACIRSIRNHAGNHPVYVISKKTIENYVELPKIIEKRLQQGEMRLVHLTDYLRFALLEKYGGMWLDATIFCSKTIPESCFDIPLFTGKLPEKKGEYISDYQWTSFCMAGWKGNSLFTFFREAAEQYWEKNGKIIDYLLIDYLIYIAKENNVFIRKEIDAVPITNPGRFELCNALKSKELEINFDNVFDENTWLNKLTRHEEFSEFDASGRPTVYHRIINE